MARDPLRERFLAVFSKLSRNADNQRLNLELGWREDTYRQMHAALVEGRTIVLGQGCGSSFALAGRDRPPVEPCQPVVQKAKPAQRREQRAVASAPETAMSQRRGLRQGCERQFGRNATTSTPQIAND